MNTPQSLLLQAAIDANRERSGETTPSDSLGLSDGQADLIGLLEMAQDDSDPELQELAIEQLRDLGEL